MARVSLKELESKIKRINKRIANKGIKKKIMLGQRYNRKYLDLYKIYNGKWSQTGSPLGVGTSGELLRVLEAIETGMDLITK